MFFALLRAKMTVFSRQIKLDGGVALYAQAFCYTPFYLSMCFLSELNESVLSCLAIINKADIKKMCKTQKFRLILFYLKISLDNRVTAW